MPRWFEAAAGSTIFDIVVNPVDYDELMNRQFNGFEILNVIVE